MKYFMRGVVAILLLGLSAGAGYASYLRSGANTSDAAGGFGVLCAALAAGAVLLVLWEK